MKIAELKRIPSANSAPSVMRTTEGQDAPVQDTRPKWLRHKWLLIGGGALLLVIALLVMLLTQWSDLRNVVSADRLRVVSVTKGHFIRDVAAQGTA